MHQPPLRRHFRFAASHTRPLARQATAPVAFGSSPIFGRDGSRTAAQVGQPSFKFKCRGSTRTGFSDGAGAGTGAAASGDGGSGAGAMGPVAAFCASAPGAPRHSAIASAIDMRIAICNSNHRRDLAKTCAGRARDGKPLVCGYGALLLLAVCIRTGENDSGEKIYSSDRVKITTTVAARRLTVKQSGFADQPRSGQNKKARNSRCGPFLRILVGSASFELATPAV